MSGYELATEVLIVVHERVTETVVVESSGCQLVMMVLAVHDGGWQRC